MHINTTQNALRYDTWFKNDFEHILATEERKDNLLQEENTDNQASARTERLPT